MGSDAAPEALGRDTSGRDTLGQDTLRNDKLDKPTADPAAGATPPAGVAAPPAAATGDGATLSSMISGRLRTDVLAGRLLPGERVRLEDIKSAFGVSWSPIREAVSRLVAEGLIVADGQRSYRVAPASRSELSEILRLRVLLETTALRAAIDNGDDAWEAEVLSAQHRLGKLESYRIEPGEVEHWETRHRVYHDTLVSACRSPILLQFCHMLHDMNERYRRVYLSQRVVDRDVAAEHRAITEATLARDADRACELLAAHIERTVSNILRTMPGENQP